MEQHHLYMNWDSQHRSLKSGRGSDQRPKQLSFQRVLGFFIFIVTSCMLSRYSIIIPTTAHLQNLYIETLKTLRHVSVLRPSSGSYIFIAKVTLEIVTD